MQTPFNEQLVKKVLDKKDALTIVGACLVGFVLAIISFALIPSFALFVVFIIGFGVYLIITRLKVEYEYIFTSGQLEIDCIYNQAKRKNLLTCEIKDADVFCYIDDKNNLGKFSSATVIKNYSSGIIKDNTYAFLINIKGEHMKIIFEPNEKLLKAIGKYLPPRKIFLKK